MGFHGQMAIKCNTTILDKVQQGNRCTTYSYKVWEGKRERDLDFRPEDTIIASILSSFSLSLFNVVQDLMPSIHFRSMCTFSNQISTCRIDVIHYIMSSQLLEKKKGTGKKEQIGFYTFLGGSNLETKILSKFMRIGQIDIYREPNCASHCTVYT